MRRFEHYLDAVRYCVVAGIDRRRIVRVSMREYQITRRVPQGAQ